jgi:hypothetical protein
MSDFVFDTHTFQNYLDATEEVILKQLEKVGALFTEAEITMEGPIIKPDSYYPRLELILVGYEDSWAEQKSRNRTVTWSVTGYQLRNLPRKDLSDMALKTQLTIEQINGLMVEGVVEIPYFTGVNDNFNVIFDTYSDDRLRFFQMFFTTFYEL